MGWACGKGKEEDKETPLENVQLENRERDGRVTLWWMLGRQVMRARDAEKWLRVVGTNQFPFSKYFHSTLFFQFVGSPTLTNKLSKSFGKTDNITLL
jgi:hypothetical protein